MTLMATSNWICSFTWRSVAPHETAFSAASCIRLAAGSTASRRITNQAPHALQNATTRHRMIYEALAARDPRRAEAAMRDHLMRTVRAMVEEEVVS